MATKFAIETVFKATDMVSGTMRRMTRSVLKGGERMERAFVGVAKSSSKAAAAISGIGGAGFAGVAALSSADVRAQQLAKSVGVSVALAEQLAAASGSAGFEFDNVIDLVEEMNNKLGESAGLEEITPVTESLQLLGLSFEKIKNLAPEEQFKTITNAALQMEDAQKAAAAADILMGGEANKLIGVLRQQGRTVDDIIKKYDDMSIRSKESREGAEAFTSALSVVKFGAFGALKEMSGLLAAELTPALESLAKWMSENREQISAFVKIAAAGIGRLAKAIGSGLADGIKDLQSSDIGAFFEKAASSASALEGSIDEVFDVVRKTVAKISTFVQVMSYLAAATLAYRATLVAISVASRIAAATTIAMTVATTAWAAITKAAAAGMAALRGAILAVNFVMYANPIGLVIAAVVALIGVAGLLIANWDKVGAFFVGLWESVKGAFATAIDSIKAFSAPFTDMAGLLIASWGQVGAFFVGLWEGVKGAFATAIDSIKALIAPFMAVVDGVRKVWSKLRGEASEPIDAVINTHQKVIATTGDGLPSTGDAGSDPVGAEIGTPQKAMTTAGDGVISPQEGIVRSLNENRSSAEVTLRNETSARAEVTQQSGPMTLQIAESGAF